MSNVLHNTKIKNNYIIHFLQVIFLYVISDVN